VPAQISTSQALKTSVAPRSTRLRESAANGSAHSTYQDITQDTQAIEISPAQPAGLTQRLSHQATPAHTAQPASAASVKVRRTCASAPPWPVA
jgi:TnpA family transposase